ncbi:MAG TPA: TatD family deoxyribonuclease, partial [Desulfobacteraceae bacterium]|nr:TatD family deoxyribonuclease [Desulfobacteraceae bacterium]
METLPMFDSHAHLDMSEFDADRGSTIERAKAAGVDKILTVGIDTESSLAALALAKQYPGLYAAAGCHPHNSSDFTT